MAIFLDGALDGISCKNRSNYCEQLTNAHEERLKPDFVTQQLCLVTLVSLFKRHASQKTNGRKLSQNITKGAFGTSKCHCQQEVTMLHLNQRKAENVVFFNKAFPSKSVTTVAIRHNSACSRCCGCVTRPMTPTNIVKNKSVLFQ